MDAPAGGGTGRLAGRKALITGADSGIGAATAIAFAREGADVAMSYLPEEERDAQRIAGGPAMAVPQRFELVSLLEQDGFLFSRYRRPRG